MQELRPKMFKIGLKSAINRSRFLQLNDMSYSLKIDKDKPDRKFLQIVDQILIDLTNGKIRANQQLPSINNLSRETGVSRDTAEKAYKRLKDLGLVISIPGKGIYALDTVVRKTILLIVDELNEARKDFYDALVRKLGSYFCVDIAIHHGRPDELNSIIGRSLGVYNFFAVVPIFRSGFAPASYVSCLDLIAHHELLVVDQKGFIPGRYRCIYRDFKNDILKALQLNAVILKKYTGITTLSNLHDFHQTEILDGISEFCVSQNRPHRILRSVNETQLIGGELFIVLTDDQIVELIKMAASAGLEIGKDIGIISANDSVFIDLLDISAFSTNAYQMGLTAAELILANEPRVVRCNLEFIKRKSV